MQILLVKLQGELSVCDGVFMLLAFRIGPHLYAVLEMASQDGADSAAIQTVEHAMIDVCHCQELRVCRSACDGANVA
jgi:hypothetical protein